MENMIYETTQENITIYGKEEIANLFDNPFEKKRFLNGIAYDFKDLSNEISVMKISDDLMLAKIENNNKIYSRIYRKDGCYVELNNGEDIDNNVYSILEAINKLKPREEVKEEIVYKDNYGKYIKSIPDFVVPPKTLKMIQDYIYSDVNILLKGGPGTF